MKTFITTFGLATTLALAPFAGSAWAQDDTAPAPTQAPAPGDSSVSFQTFYDQLASQGSWVQTDQYGYVFQPTESNSNWRPYTYGHWVNTDAGMTWVSDDSFGWATDHYGRWVNLANYGWVWVPGYTWAPAWVSWRDGGDDVGWAPLPPASDVGIDFFGGNDFDFGLGFGFHIGDDCDVAYGIGPACYNFCPVAYIGDRDCWRHFHNRGDNFALINSTRNVTNINVARDGAGRFGRVHAEGPSVAALNARAHNRIETARLAEVSGRGEAGLRGNTLAVYAPRVDRNTVRTSRPGNASAHIANATVNRGTDIRHPLAVNSRVTPAAATAAQIHAASLAQNHVSASAKIATAQTRIAHPLNQSLTSMRTETRTPGSSVNTQRFNNSIAPESHVANVPASTESRYTGEPAATHVAAAPAEESRFTGEPSHPAPVVHHSSSFATAQGGYHPDRVTQPSAPTYHPEANTPVFHSPTPVYHPQASAPVFHSSEPAYHPASAPVFHSSEPAYHPHVSAPAYHPQASFHAAAPAAHFSGGGAVHSAPAAHAGGGGGMHASAPAGNGQRH